MQTRTVQVETPDGPMPLYEAVPAQGSARAAVLVVQEAFGVNEHIEEVCRRLAAEGYHAVAPHLFHRTGAPVLPYGDFSAVMPHMARLDDDAVLDDVDASLGHLRDAGWRDAAVGTVGFCMGGRVAFLVAVRRRIGAAVTFYGGGIVTSRFRNFGPLVDEAGTLQTPWLGLFGDEDQSIPVEDVERLRAAVESAPVGHDVVRYAGAAHGFFCDARPSFHAEAAADGWRRTLDWFGRHLLR